MNMMVSIMGLGIAVIVGLALIAGLVLLVVTITERNKRS